MGHCPLPDITLENLDRTLKQTLSQSGLYHVRDPIGRMSLNKLRPISMHTTLSCSRPLKHATNKLLSPSPHTPHVLTQKQPVTNPAIVHIHSGTHGKSTNIGHCHCHCQPYICAIWVCQTCSHHITC